MDYSDLPNLASPQLGGRIIFATDEWFAAAENVIKDDDPVWKAEEYTPFGKWMDGWESRRRRTEGHDWSIIQLGMKGIIRAIEIDTAFFTGNFSPKVSVQGISSIDKHGMQVVEQLVNIRQLSTVNRPEFGRMGLKAEDDDFQLVAMLNSPSWDTLVPLQPLGAGYSETRKNIFQISSQSVTSFLRLNMGPDGGIARIRVYGEVVVDPELIPVGIPIDLVAIENGGMAISCSNKHYGHPRNLIAPGRGNCMGDGWETARQPKRPAIYEKGPDGLMVLPGYDWAVLQLGVNGIVGALEIDTNFYKGNFPESCQVEACMVFRNDNSIRKFLTEDGHRSMQWQILLPRSRLGPGQKHCFDEKSLRKTGPISHLKVTIYPDGGIMRIRAIGMKHQFSKL